MNSRMGLNPLTHAASALPAKAMRFALPALAITLFAVHFLYRETALAMVNMWARSETNSDFIAKAYTALSRIIGRGDDSAVIVVYAAGASDGGGDAALTAFAPAALPAINAMLQRTRDAR